MTKTPKRSADLRYEESLLKWRVRHREWEANGKLRLEAVAEFRKLSLLHSRGTAYRLVNAMFAEKGLKISAGTIWRWNKKISQRMDRSTALYRLAGPMPKPPKKPK